ncbi:MAG: carbonic anhydrase [Amaricoccus sp.]
MIPAKPLPSFLIERHRNRRSNRTVEERSRMLHLAVHGQNPRAMVIACCDSRLMVRDLFGAEAGEFFVHRNIANLIPPCTLDGRQHGTSATIEYAVTVLKVRHLIVMGHSQCGGVAGCFDMQAGGGPAPEPGSFVGDWLQILAPSVPPLIQDGLERTPALRALEHQGVLVSLANLMTFEFVSEAVNSGKLQLHGLWNDISDGELEVYNSETNSFYRI